MKRDGMAAFQKVFMAAPNKVDRSKAPPPVGAVRIVERAIPPALAVALYNQSRSFYEARQWANQRATPTASVILISGCQDNQTSADGAVNGLFTEKLLNVWNNGAFQGTLPQFHQAIVALMPSTQTPNYFTLGPDDSVFTNSRPLTIVGGTAQPSGPGQTAATPPSVTAPSAAARDGAPPSFAVTLGSNPYYVFEITSNPTYFGHQEQRTSANFYASWADPSVPARLSSPTFQLTQSAWNAINGSDVLYYRVGSTSSPEADHWDNYLVSVSDGDASTSAPSIAITSAGGRDVPLAELFKDYRVDA
jgi:metacaspase-1